MSEPVAEQIDARCPLCQKTCTNRRARSKHLSYCRKKHQSSPVPRRKACDECVRAKVRCNLNPAGCFRCTSRGHRCSLQQHRSGAPDFGNPIPDAPTSIVSPAVPPNINDAFSIDNSILSLDGFGPDLADPDITDPNINTIPVDTQLPPSTSTWGNGASGPGFLDALDLLTPLDGEYEPDANVEAAPQSDETGRLSDYTMVVSRRAQRLSPSIPASLLYQGPSSILERRNFSQPEHVATGDIALHMLRSYLYVMADKDCVPPFIHPKYRDLAGSSTSRPSPLHAAMRLAKLLCLGRRMNKTLIWRLIRIEQERILNDHVNFTDWETLEALQSLVLYILMRINEGRHDYTNFDTQIFMSLNAICSRITKNFGTLVSPDELKGKMLPWRDWVFYESRRRSATVILIVDSILHVRIAEAPKAMPDYPSAPAPSPRALWDAESELDWAVGYAGHLDANARHGMLRNGDLVALKEEAGDQNDRWYEYADSFGLLVTLAARLII